MRREECGGLGLITLFNSHLLVHWLNLSLVIRQHNAEANSPYYDRSDATEDDPIFVNVGIRNL